jgi:hypothetical protein
MSRPYARNPDMCMAGRMRAYSHQMSRTVVPKVLDGR